MKITVDMRVLGKIWFTRDEIWLFHNCFLTLEGLLSRDWLMGKINGL